MSKYAIQVDNLGKEYIVGGAEQHHESFREMLTGALTAPLRKLRKLGGTAGEEERFWALKEVSFNVEQGEVLGIIGRNGAGKSTLLKILSRITSPTEGRVVTRGRVASLLEVGTGFHPELTGRENIYLNGAILGMSRQEIDANFDEIVAFAEIGMFLDTPVKRYSSGMHVRLAFAVAAHLDADILIVDEVLAVGDQAFQKKCLGKMGDVGRTGKTILFVSHNMGAVNSLCSRCIILEEGEKLFDGRTTDVIKQYLSNTETPNGTLSARGFRGPLQGEIIFEELKLNGVAAGKPVLIEPEQELVFEACGQSERAFENFEFQLSVFRDGIQVVTVHDADLGTDLKAGAFRSFFYIPRKTLRPGEYRFGIGGIRKGGSQWLWGADLGSFSVLEKWSPDFRETSPGMLNCNAVGKRIN